MGIFNSNLTYGVNSSFRPIIYKGDVENDFVNLESLLKHNQNIKVCDTIKQQIGELIKCRNPTIQFNSGLLEEYIQDHVSNPDLDRYGVWVFYPWSSMLVHCLPEDEFIEVRTNRNKNKITHNEQRVLASKCIGVIGLSVGQSVALTLAMERSCGELRIADFDTIDLSNLNRIRTGIHNIGIPKTVVVAREIAEIDPFLIVTCFQEGITEATLNTFLTKDGEVDLLIDECDSLEIKIQARLEARKLKIPVVMDTSDRGMIDVERFDLECNRPILHGLIDEQTYRGEDKMTLVKKIIDFDNISDRLKESFGEVGSTLSSWPQLASSVVYGGGMAADVVRRILLKSTLKSGRYYNELF